MPPLVESNVAGLAYGNGIAPFPPTGAGKAAMHVGEIVNGDSELLPLIHVNSTSPDGNRIAASAGRTRACGQAHWMVINNDIVIPRAVQTRNMA